ncbi:hypothetical protein AB5N96_12210 [Chryseomicrobium imtechense]
MSSINLDEQLAEICTIYQSFKDDLISTSIKIENIFTELLRKNAPDYNLNYINSAYPGYYFSFSPRIKTEESLEEKMVRSGQLLKLIEQDEEEVEKSLKSMNDLIGIKILGEVEQDVLSIFKILRDNQSELKKSGINFLTSFSGQPTTMKNDLEIYKFNCEYVCEDNDVPTKYLFELQIKSKLLSAWGDMEHRIFYKDYVGTAVRNSVQQLMNKVGHNLKSIDELLYTIRVSNSNYLKERDFYLFVEDVQMLFTDELKKYLNTTKNFDLHKIIALLFEFKNIDREKKEIDFSSFSIPTIDESMLDDRYKHLKIFEVLKKYSFNIRILEYIYTAYTYSDYPEELIEVTDILTAGDERDKCHAYDLYKYLEYYKEIIVRRFSDLSIDEPDLGENYLDEVLNFIFTNATSEDVLLLSGKYKLILDFYSNFKTVYDNEFEEDFEEDMKVPGMEQNELPDNHRNYYFLLTKFFSLYIFESVTNFSPYLVSEEESFFLDYKDEIINFMKKVNVNIQKSDEVYEQVVQFTNSNSLLGSEE